MPFRSRGHLPVVVWSSISTWYQLVIRHGAQAGRQIFSCRLLVVGHISVSALCTLKPKKSIKKPLKNLKTLKKIPKNLGFSSPGKQEVKVIWQKAPHGGPIPRLGVTPGGQNLKTRLGFVQGNWKWHHWIDAYEFYYGLPYILYAWQAVL